MHESDILIEAEELTKRYGSLTAISDVSFACRRGEVVGFLGPNGAGKTTTMRILTGYMPPTSGTAYIAGFDTLRQSMQAREQLGYLPETIALYPEMSVESYLAFIGRIRRIDDLWNRVDDVLESVGLLDRAESFIGSLSKGMRQRVGLAQAILHEPDVVILDEPTIGLDPRQVVDVRHLIKELGESHTILLSTHILSEVEQICNRVIMIFNGQVWSDISLDDLRRSDSEQLVVRLGAPAENCSDLLENVAGVHSVRGSVNNEFVINTDGLDETRTQVAAAVVANGWGLLEMRTERITLEALFLRNMREAESVALTDEEE